MAVLLSLKGVSKSYWRGSNETVVLADVSLEVHAGEFVAVWGRQGAGKTTLATVAAGLTKPDEGRVCCDGHDLAALPRAREPQLHEAIGWVRRGGPSSGNYRTVVDYVSLPLLARHSPRRAKRIATASLKRLGVADCGDESWENLTDGEQTLVAIAHALVRGPRLLIADDPTASLDVLQREQVVGLLRRAADEQDIGVLVTVPDMPEAAYADRVGSLSEGRLTMSGGTCGGLGRVIDFPGRQSA
jgi:ABC-type lipoprotein export system ATPase subunit